MIKKIIIILSFAFILYSQFSFGQTRIGAKIGYSLGNLSDNSNNIYSRDFKSTSGIDFGIIAEYPISENFSIQHELSYVQRGGERNGLQPVQLDPLERALSEIGVSIDQLNQLILAQGGAEITDANPLYAQFNSLSELDYIEIPMLAKYSWGLDWRFYVTGGPYIGFLLNGNQITSGNGTFYLDSDGKVPLKVPNPFYSPDNPELGPPFIDLPSRSFDAETDSKNDLNTFNFGLQGGVGIIRKLAEKHEIFFDVRASYGFIPLQKNEVYGKSKVGAVVFSLGYAFIL